jgi:glycosyltransferase involved in cell wall biosynthesis
MVVVTSTLDAAGDAPPSSVTVPRRPGRRLRVCAVSFKPCWQDQSGRWMSFGGFPFQMAAIGSLFDDMTLVIVRVPPRAGGIPLPAHARVVPLRSPRGADLRRKVSVAARMPYFVWKIAASAWNADVVHVPLPGDVPLLGMWIALAMRKRVLARYGGSWVANTQSTFMNRVTKACMRRFAGGRNVMLATGDGDSAPAAGVEWVFSTALAQRELDRIAPRLDRGLSNPPRLVYAGRLSPEKGVAVLIDALGLLARDPDFPRLHLTILGDGDERAALEARAASVGCLDRVAFPGQVGRETLSSALDVADVCVQPSLTEGFSKAWLDAMAHGLPVLTSNVGAASAVIGQAGERGWLVAPGDSRALADAIRRVVVENQDWTSLRRRCRLYVEGRTLEAWAERIGTICAAHWGWTMTDGRLQA